MDEKQPDDGGQEGRPSDVIVLLVLGLYFLVGTGVVAAGLASIMSVWLPLWLAVVAGIIVAVLGVLCLFKNSDTLVNAAALWLWVIVLGGILWPVGQKARHFKAEQSHHQRHPTP